MEREEREEGGGEGCMEGGMWVVTGLPDLMVRFTVNLTILVQFHANFTDSSFFHENRYEYKYWMYTRPTSHLQKQKHAV